LTCSFISIKTKPSLTAEEKYDNKNRNLALSSSAQLCKAAGGPKPWGTDAFSLAEHWFCEQITTSAPF